MRHSTGLNSLVETFWRYRQLIWQMTRREILGRYRGSVLGLAWSFFNPLLMLSVYAFVFSVVFKARWGSSGAESKLSFAFILFVGMIVHGLFAEVSNRAPGLIVGNVNYVKKVVFPLELLPIVTMGAALFHSLVSLAVMLTAFALVNGFLHWTVIFAPLILMPLIIFTLGLAWMLASIGVFVRDIAQSIGIVTTIMMFLAPVFFPLTAIPEQYRAIIMVNPLTFIIVQTRAVIISGDMPDWSGLLTYTIFSVAFAWAGYAWFQKIRGAFADVL